MNREDLVVGGKYKKDESFVVEVLFIGKHDIFYRSDLGTEMSGNINGFIQDYEPVKPIKPESEKILMTEKIVDGAVMFLSKDNATIRFDGVDLVWKTYDESEWHITNFPNARSYYVCTEILEKIVDE